MKKLYVFTLLIISIYVQAQTNSYPASGNVKIFATDVGWSEGIAIVKPAGWSGVRFTRSDPSSGNYNGNWAIGYNVNTANDFSFSTTNGSTQYDGVFHLSNSTRNVGIGTTNPVVKLQVEINSPTTDYATAPGSLYLRNTSTLEGNLNGISFGDASGWGVAGLMTHVRNIGSHTAALSFWTRKNGAAPTPQMMLDENGNLGIGTTSPDAKLAVVGQIHATEVKVTATVPGPDYVFEKEYSLPSLQSVKTYIDQNKHLPEIPSAKEMETNGINLSEMNLLLLKKVEELTLYILEQEKRIQALEGKK